MYGKGDLVNASLFKKRKGRAVREIYSKKPLNSGVKTDCAEESS